MDEALADDLRSELSRNAILAFLTIENDALEDPIRIVSDPLDFEVGGDLFVGCPFEISVVSDTDQHPVAELRIQNVDRQIGDAVQAAVGRITVAVAIRSTAGFDLTAIPRAEVSGDSLILAYRDFELVEVTVNDVQVTGRLMLRDYTQEPWPSGRATKSRCPALYR